MGHMQRRDHVLLANNSNGVDDVSIEQLIPLLLKISIFLVVAGVGLKARAQGPLLGHDRGVLLRSLVALHILVPLVVTFVVIAFDPVRPVRVALVLLAISPIAPVLPMQQSKLSSAESFIVRLFVASALLAIVAVPASVSLLSTAGNLGVSISPLQVASVLLMSVIVPVSAGMLCYWLAPSTALRIEPLVSKLGSILLLLVVIAVVIGAWRAMMTLVGDGTILVIACAVVLALLIGHVMGGPDPDERVVVALAASARHPGMAMAIAAYNYPTEQTILAAIVLYLLVCALVSAPYKAWFKGSRAAQRAGTHGPLPRGGTLA